MATYNVLERASENSLTSFPLTEELEVQNFIVDASFIQFDNFIPQLNRIFVDSDAIKLDITFDFGKLTSISFTRQAYLAGENYRHVRIYTPENDRYLGVLSFSSGAQTLWEQNTGRQFTYNIPFYTSTVKSIPSSCGVFLFDNRYGAVELTKPNTDNTIFYNISTIKNSITFNAVTNHSVPSDSLGGLRKINLVRPIRNNITLAANDVIKFTPQNAATLNIDLASNSASSTVSVPTLFS